MASGFWFELLFAAVRRHLRWGFDSRNTLLGGRISPEKMLVLKIVVYGPMTHMAVGADSISARQKNHCAP